MERKTAQRQGKTLILGVGNLLLQDEGVGVHAIQALAKLAWPEQVNLQEGATAGLDLLYLVEGYARLIVIDAVRAGGKPGTLYRFTPADVIAQRPALTSLHQVGLLDALALARELGQAPAQVVIIGVEPKSMAWGMELSPEVQAALPQIIERVREEIGKLGD